MCLKARPKILFLVTLLNILAANSFSQEKTDFANLTIKEIILEGNKITKEKIVCRELLFNEGESISLAELEQKAKRSRENLLNTSLFNFVTITYAINSGNVSIHVSMQERWYIWPYPVLEHADRNFSSFLKNQEWSRIDYGLFLLINNFRGRKEILKLKTIFGFNNELNLYYYNPFIDKKQRNGFGIDIRYIRNHEVPFTVSNDELEYLKLTDEYARKIFQVSGFYTYRHEVYTHHILNLKYSNIYIDDSVFTLNGNYFFDQNNETEFLSLGYVYNFDKRDSKVYPLKGPRVNFSVYKNGLGILSNEGNIGLKAILDENIQLLNRLYVNSSIIGQVYLNNHNSFYFSKAIGYDNYLRGMEYYVSNGNSYYISKFNLKFEAIPPIKFDLNFISSAKFSKVHFAMYANLFFDTGYVDSDYTTNNTITNEFLYSGGIGIDLVTYYDKVLRIEYSLNKFGEQGIFFHLGAPIIEN